MKFDLVQIAQRAWQITWKHKVLWVFGFFFSFGLGGGGGNSNVNFDANSFSSGGNAPTLPPELLRPLEDLLANTALLAGLGFLLICVSLLLSFAFYALGVMGRGGLIVGTRLAEANGAVTFGEAWRGAARRFWTLVGVNLLIGLPIIVLSLVLAISAVGGVIGLIAGATGEMTELAGVSAIFLLCLTPLLCIVPFISLFTNFFSTLASLNAVIEDLGVMAAIRRAWAVLTQNPVDVVVLGVVMALAQGIASFVISLPIALVVLGGVGAGVATSLTLGSLEALTAPLLIAGLCLVVYLPVLWVLMGMVLTWVNAAWTLAYEKLIVASGGTPTNPNGVTL